MKQLFLIFSVITAFSIFTSPLYAKITLSKLFTDNMVMQQKTEAPVWGIADPGKTVTIVTSWDQKTYTTTAGNNGNWQVKVITPEAGGPYNISFSDGKKLTLKNILIGEVWICSGQSNMEMPLAGWGMVNNYKNEIADANYSQIRLLHVEQATSNLPLDDLKATRGGWQVCTPETIENFSSVAYFFGRNLNKNLDIPIGLISTSWGGTIAEAWTSGQSLAEMPYFKEAVQDITNVSEEEAQKQYEQKFKEWNDYILANDKGYRNNVAVWSETNLDDGQWNKMELPGLWEEKGLNDFDGIVWFRKAIEIPDQWAKKDLTLKLAMIDDNDITYFNGIKIGETNGYNHKRIYKIPGKLVKPGKAVITIRVTDTGGGGGIHGETADLSVAPSTGKESATSLAGTWKYQVAIDLKKQDKAPQSVSGNPNRPTVLYNAMIHPVIPYAIRGAIWYQGESNADRAYQYRELFPLMIRDWRIQWGHNFPFYFVQLANFMKRSNEPEESQWAELREAQLQTLQLENTGMAVSIDIGDADDIHPKNKQDVGSRLALNALAGTYGQEIVYSGPIFRSYQLEGNKIRINFSHTGKGLKSKDSPNLKGFAIAGPDHLFHWVDAIIDGNSIVVSSPEVRFPVAVRYAWADNPECNLYNEEGLPASPFRTDDWK